MTTMNWTTTKFWMPKALTLATIATKKYDHLNVVAVVDHKEIAGVNKRRSVQ